MKTELKKLVIEIAGKKLELTPDEAKELKNILADLFGADKTTHVHHYNSGWNWPYYTTATTGIFNAGTTTTGYNWTGTALPSDGTYTLTNRK